MSTSRVVTWQLTDLYFVVYYLTPVDHFRGDMVMVPPVQQQYRQSCRYIPPGRIACSVANRHSSSSDRDNLVARRWDVT